jgi:ABC-type antimicrobial peptide transport system permease subunit
MSADFLAGVAVGFLLAGLIAGVIALRRWARLNPPDALDEIERDAW